MDVQLVPMTAQMYHDYFRVLGIPVLYADALVTNTRSRHVLEMVGFRLLREEGNFKYYSTRRED